MTRRAKMCITVSLDQCQSVWLTTFRFYGHQCMVRQCLMPSSSLPQWGCRTIKSDITLHWMSRHPTTRSSDFQLLLVFLYPDGQRFALTVGYDSNVFLVASIFITVDHGVWSVQWRTWMIYDENFRILPDLSLCKKDYSRRCSDCLWRLRDKMFTKQSFQHQTYV